MNNEQEQQCREAFGKWFDQQRHWGLNEPTCKRVWQAAWSAAQQAQPVDQTAIVEHLKKTAPDFMPAIDAQPAQQPVETAVAVMRELAAKEAELWQQIGNPEHSCGSYIAAAIRGIRLPFDAQQERDAEDATRFRYVLAQANTDFDESEAVQLVVRHNNDSEIISWIDAAIAAQGERKS